MMGKAKQIKTLQGGALSGVKSKDGLSVEPRRIDNFLIESRRHETYGSIMPLSNKVQLSIPNLDESKRA
jgi:hypothetical protein